MNAKVRTSTVELRDKNVDAGDRGVDKEEVPMCGVGRCVTVYTVRSTSPMHKVLDKSGSTKKKGRAIMPECAQQRRPFFSVFA